MYDLVVIGQGLTGMLSSIIAREQNKKVALVSKGTGRLIQSSGVMDLVPGTNKGFSEWLEIYGLTNRSKINIKEAVKQFKQLTEKLGYPYLGELEKPIEIVTASGYVKETTLYPETISPIPTSGTVVVVGFNEIVDFQANFVKENLQKEKPNLKIHTAKVSLGQQSLRTMTQLDAARLIDSKSVRDHCLKQIKHQLQKSNINDVDLFIFPSALGIAKWQETYDQLKTELNAEITEAPGMPPNATSVRLNELLKKYAIKLGVRFYSDTEVCGSEVDDNNKINSILIKNHHQTNKISGRDFIIATGGILGGGHQVTHNSIVETALQQEVDENGSACKKLENAFFIGAAQGTHRTHLGITGGVYSIVSSYEAISKINQTSMRGVQHA